jgi:hypothetical protein
MFTGFCLREPKRKTTGKTSEDNISMDLMEICMYRWGDLKATGSG